MHCKSDKEFAEKVLFAKSLETLTKVTALHLESAQITDAGLDPLWALTQLEELDLSGTNITDAGVIPLKKALPDCNIGHRR